MIGMIVTTSHGDYRAGDELWCDRVEPDGFGQLLNRDILVPRPAGRFIFGRLLQREGGKMLILPPEAGGRQQIVADPPWAAVAVKLIRSL